MPDIKVDHFGSVVLLEGGTERGWQWMRRKLPAVIEYAGCPVVQPRFLPDIIEGARADGLEVEEGTTP